MVDRNTVVVGVAPDISQATFNVILHNTNSPAWPEANACYDAIVRYRVSPAFALAVFFEESSAGTNPNAVVLRYQTFNPGNTRTSHTGDYPVVMVPSKGVYVKFPNWAAGFADLAGRLVDEDFVYVKEGRRTIGDIIPRWAPATDQNVPEAYIANVITRMNRWGVAASEPSPGETPVPDIVFGRVPHPGYLDRLITNKPAGVGWDNLGKRSVKGVVYHRMIGTLWGTDGFFRDPSVGALTDYGVGNAATDGAANDGLIIRWNDPLGTRSGWASGKVSEPYGDGKAFLDKYAGPSGIGVNVVNRDQASIEISGIAYTTPISEKVKDTVAAISAYWADQYDIPWDVYPIAPQDGFSFIRWHQEFTIGTGKVCPGKVVMDATNDIIERTRAILKKYQTTVVAEPTPTPEPEPTPVPSPAPTPPSGPKYAEKHPLDSPPRVRKVNEILFYPFKSGASVRLKAIRDVTPQEWASPTASATGPLVKKGSTKVISYVTVGSDDSLWMVGADGSRYEASAFEPAAS